MSLQELRESVATDLEDLLNSRMANFNDSIDAFPLVKKSIVQFGIIDFVGLSTANPTDRDKICQSIAASITAHEPRLKQIKVEMLLDGQNMGALCLSIQAYLNIHPLYEPVIFDALPRCPPMPTPARRATIASTPCRASLTTPSPSAPNAAVPCASSTDRWA